MSKGLTRPDLSPETFESREATADESSSSQPSSAVRQSLWKLTKGFTTKVSPFKRSRNRNPVVQNIDAKGTSSNQSIDDTSHLHPSNENMHPTTLENPSGHITRGTSRELASKVLDAPSGVEGGPDPQSVDAGLQDAHEASESMNLLGRDATSMASAAQSAPANLDTADNLQTTYLQPLRIFDTAIQKIANVHPYTKMALGVLSAASQIILAQADRDQSVHRLLKKLDEVYRFMIQDDTLGQISSMHNIVGRIAQQIQECARFIRDYSETKSFWKRLGKNVVSETDNMIIQYSGALDALMQQFRDQAVRDIAISVQYRGETLDLSGMTYATGAGMDTTKQCLPGTRTDILSQITEWINSSGDAVPRVMWLSGPAGTGKSAIAHTIANWFNDMGGLGSCFCFDRHREADRRHEKIFSTIARDLADRDPGMKRALADVVKDANSLKNTMDIIQQWHKLLMEPLTKLSGSTVGPVLIVIEALDESGGEETRRNLLRILAGKLQNKDLPKITELPLNFRIIVTSRPLRDIDKEFEGGRHILRLSMDDIPPAVAERDIHTFVSDELKGLSVFGDREFANLAAKADGLFEWARLACEYIQKNLLGVNPIFRFNAVMNRDPGKWTNKLYDMYRLILTEMMPRDQYDDVEYEEALKVFRSVMGQILGAAEPLPLHSLTVMRDCFPSRGKHYKVDIVQHMGSLLSGTTNSCTPIRPLHVSFHEFLTDQSCSGDFFVEVSKEQHRDLAFASLQVMKHGLRFNICDLKSSYLPNCQDTGLRERIATCIPPHLSYSCRFWAVHVRATDFDTELAQEIRSFFDDERLLFWIEVLGLLNTLNCAAAARPLIAQWLKGHSAYEGVLSTAMDVQRFVQVFGTIILQSTPHLYVSALPFSPSNSTIATKFTARFTNSLRLTSRRDLTWTTFQTAISGHTGWVFSVSCSPDGTRIVSGSSDTTVRLWDAATGQPLGEPLREHTDWVLSVSFSPEGTRIASGSADNTIRLWDAVTGQSLGEPLRGHTDAVLSVSFSPDGAHIVSGSKDHTIRLWDATMGQLLCAPLEGHTGLIWSVSFSPDGTRIVSGSSDHTIRLWDAATRRPLSELWHTDSVWSVSFSPDGTRIVSGSADKTVRLWDAGTGEPLCEPLLGHTDAVLSVSFSPDGTHIVSGSRDHTIRLWDATMEQLLDESLEGHTGLIWSVSFSPDGTHIVSGSSDTTVRLWDAATGRPSSEQWHTDSVWSVSFSPDGARMVSSSSDHTLRLWDVATGEPCGEPLRGHTDLVWSVSFSPDGSRIVSGSSDTTIRLWDAVTGQPLCEPLRRHTDPVLSVSFSPDATHIVSGSEDKTIQLWDAATGRPLGEPLRGHTDVVSSVSFSPDGTRIVSGSADHTSRLWDTVTGQPFGEPLRGHTGSVSSVLYSPDGYRIASCSEDNTIRLWDAATGQPLCEPLQGHTDLVWSVSFSPDGTRIVSSSSDRTIRLWDAVTGQPLGWPLRGHTNAVFSVSFSPDGTRIVSGSGDGTLRLWYAVFVQPFQEYAETNSSAFFLDKSRIIPRTQENPTMSTNTWNNCYICFSSSLKHALYNPGDLLEGASHHDSDSTPFLLGDDGWMIGPDRRLLFWVPHASREPFYNPWTALVISRGSAELDLSLMAHGPRWSNCRNAPT